MRFSEKTLGRITSISAKLDVIYMVSLRAQRGNLTTKVAQAKFVTYPMTLPRCARNDIFIGSS